MSALTALITTINADGPYHLVLLNQSRPSSESGCAPNFSLVGIDAVLLFPVWLVCVFVYTALCTGALCEMIELVHRKLSVLYSVTGESRNYLRGERKRERGESQGEERERENF